MTNLELAGWLAVFLASCVLLAACARHAWRDHLDPDKIRADQLQQARRTLLTHQLAAEQHAAIAAGWVATIKRLQETQQ